MRTLHVRTSIHGRVLVREAAPSAAAVLGFHGYMENAAIQMARLEAIARSENWTLVSVQALHRFYKGRSEEVVASWMTREDRESAIADNVAYINQVMATVGQQDLPLFFTGFSQGVAMAFRAGVRGSRPSAGIIAVGGDVPPELFADPAAVFPPVLLARGARDEWYTSAKLDADVEQLKSRGVDVQAITYDGAHEWTDEVAEAAAAFVKRIVSGRR